MKEQDEFWTDDVAIGEGGFYRASYTIRLKLHEEDEFYSRSEGEELVPLRHQQGTRRYFLAKPYILIPDITLSVRLYPYATPADQGAIGEVASSRWEGLKHEEVGSAQAWYYPQDRLLVLWEALLHERHAAKYPAEDRNLATLWTGFEVELLKRCRGAERIVTPYAEPMYEPAAWQAFLRSQGYSALTTAAFTKAVTPSSP